MHLNKILLLFAFIFIICSCKNKSNADQTISIDQTSAAPVLNYTVVKEYPHNTSLFTEGLLFHDNKLYESTGSPKDLSFTKSLIVVDDLSTENFETKIELDKTKYFGEGIVFLNDKLYQLTYTNKIGFVYDAKTFKQIGTFNYTGEGWSLTTDGKHLIMSDGTNKLNYLDAVTLSPTKTLSIKEDDVPVTNLNELEFIKGFIYANIWKTYTIIKIDTASGNVVAKLDLTSVALEAKNKNPDVDVMNGIAYDSTSDKIFITGKLWANIYEIRFLH